MVTNGLNHYFCKMDFENENISFLLNFQLYPLNKQNENSSRYPQLEWSYFTGTILPSILSFSPEATVYVADNASTDDSIAFISANFLRYKCENDSNFGFARDIMKP
jgi:hypothetical protein